MTENIRQILAWGMPQGAEWFIILVIALLIWGKRLPDVARGLGRSLSEFKKGTREAEDMKNEIVSDVKNAKDDIVKQTKDAAGLNGH